MLVRVKVVTELLIDTDPDEVPPQDFHQKIHNKLEKVVNSDDIESWFEEKLRSTCLDIAVGVELSAGEKLLAELSEEAVIKPEGGVVQ